MISRNTNILALLVLTACGMLCYAHVLGGEFVFDDRATILQDPYVQNRVSLWRQMLQKPMRYVAYMTFKLQVTQTGLDVGPLHFVNLVFHVATGFLLYLLISMNSRTLWQRLTCIGLAGVFLAHPAMTQGVSYISQRFVCMSAFFVLLCFYGALRAIETRRWSWMAISLASFVVAAGTKETAVSLVPALLLVLTFAKEYRFSRRHATAAWIILVALGAGVTLASFLSPHASPVKEMILSASYSAHVVIQAKAFAGYLFSLLSSSVLSLQHDVEPGVSAGFWLGLMAYFLMLLMGLRFLLKGRFWFGFGLVMFPITLLPEMLIPLPDQRVDHRVYLPFAFFLVGTGRGLLDNLSERHALLQRWVLVATAALVLLFASQTIDRNRVWWSSERLWQDVLEKYPDNHRAHLTLGLVAYRSSDYAKAVEFFSRLVQLYPEDPAAHINLVASLIEAGRYGDALAVGERAQQQFPDRSSFPCVPFEVAIRSRAQDEVVENAFRQCIEASSRIANVVYKKIFHDLTVGQPVRALSIMQLYQGDLSEYERRLLSGLITLSTGNYEAGFDALSRLRQDSYPDEFLNAYWTLAQVLAGENPSRESLMTWVNTETLSTGRLMLAVDLLLRENSPLAELYTGTALRRCLDRRPVCPEYECLQDRLGRVYAMMGKNEWIGDRLLADKSQCIGLSQPNK